MKEQVSFNFMLWQLIHRTVRAGHKARDKELEGWGLTSGKSSVLRVVLRLGKKATVTAISKQLLLEINTISEQLTRLENDGLIVKISDSERKNIVRIEVTDKGYKLHLKTRTQESIDRIMMVLTDKEKKELWSILTKMRGQAIEDLGMKNVDLYPPSDYPGT